jgi:hypothetical protein
VMEFKLMASCIHEALRHGANGPLPAPALLVTVFGMPAGMSKA